MPEKFIAGRPTKYDEDIHPAWAFLLASEGLDCKQIAKKMGIARSTLFEWIDKYPEFSDSIKTGKDPADARVEKSLYQRAIGYFYKERKVITEIGEDGKPRKPSKIEVTEKFALPDVTASIFWLKNRRADKWRDKQEMSISSNKGDVLIYIPDNGRDVVD